MCLETALFGDNTFCSVIVISNGVIIYCTWLLFLSGSSACVQQAAIDEQETNQSEVHGASVHIARAGRRSSVKHKDSSGRAPKW